MELRINLAIETEAQLRARASAVGLEPEEYAVQLLTATMSKPVKPQNGKELVEYWAENELIGTRPDVQDGVEHARKIRARAETRSQ